MKTKNVLFRNILKNTRETYVLFRKRLHFRMAASTYLITEVKESNSNRAVMRKTLHVITKPGPD